MKDTMTPETHVSSTAKWWITFGANGLVTILCFVFLVDKTLPWLLTLYGLLPLLRYLILERRERDFAKWWIAFGVIGVVSSIVCWYAPGGNDNDIYIYFEMPLFGVLFLFGYLICGRLIRDFAAHIGAAYASWAIGGLLFAWWQGWLERLLSGWQYFDISVLGGLFLLVCLILRERGFATRIMKISLTHIYIVGFVGYMGLLEWVIGERFLLPIVMGLAGFFYGIRHKNSLGRLWIGGLLFFIGLGPVCDRCNLIAAVLNFLITVPGSTEALYILFFAFVGAELYGLGSLMNWIYKKPVYAFTFTISMIVVLYFLVKLDY